MVEKKEKGYWIIALPREDMEHCVNVGVFGLNTKQSMGRIQPGDKIICCVTKEKPWKVIAFGEARSEMYVDDKQVFKKPGGFWYRFDFDAKQLKSSEEIDFRCLLPELSFVTNLEYWPVYFKGGVRQASEKDWNVILNSTQESCDT